MSVVVVSCGRMAGLAVGLLVLASGCSSDGDGGAGGDGTYRRDMREFVQKISAYAKTVRPGFIVVPQNGHDLLTESGEADGTVVDEYIAAISGVGQEDLFYGYDSDDAATPVAVRDRLIGLMNVAESHGVEALVTDYCSTRTKVDDSYAQSASKGYISFAADHRELDNIPPYPSSPYGVNSADVTSLSEAKNFLYLINAGLFSDKAAFLTAVRGTDYDAVIIDLFVGEEALTVSEVSSLKVKASGGKRLVIAYMSIGEAEDYRYYWRTEWSTNPPSWLAEENPDWAGNYKVRYWDEGWQTIIYGGEGSYLKRILDAGFDGVYLDVVDAFEYFENK